MKQNNIERNYIHLNTNLNLNTLTDYFSPVIYNKGDKIVYNSERIVNYDRTRTSFVSFLSIRII